MYLALSIFWFSPAVSQKAPALSNSAAPLFQEVTDVRGYKSLVLVPTNTSETVNGKFPAILFLHGISESGNDLSLLKRNGFPKTLEGDQQFPFIFIMPQCPASTEWYYTNADNVTAMRNFIEDILARFPIDPDRLYITGLSMGGIGAWYFAVKIPERFAALVPVSFRGDGWSPCPAKDIPVWAFHGKLDSVIPLEKAQLLVDQFKSCGGSIRFDIYQAGAHDGSTFGVTYNNPDLYDWLLRKKRTTLIEDYGREMPAVFSLEQNFPNPFNPSTIFSFSVPQEADVEISVFDALGKNAGEILSSRLQPGKYYYRWNAEGLSSGIYFYRITAVTTGEGTKRLFRDIKKFVVLK